MLYMVCPECGELLRHRQIIFEDKMKEVCEEMGVDYNMISQHEFDRDEEYIKKRQKIVNDLCDNICCKMNLITYIRTVELIKG
jgi:rRNA maturation protein Nop10